MGVTINGIDFDWEAPSSEIEMKGYVKLLKEAKKRFKKKNMLISVALHPWQDLGKEGYAVVDRVNLMSYDRITKTDQRHSTAKGASQDVKNLIIQGCAPDKILLGIPFYGRNTKDPSRVMTYKEIRDSYNPKPKQDQVKGMYFNGQRTVFRKTRWAQEKGLAGVFVWEAGQDSDDDSSLLKAIHRAATGKPLHDTKEKGSEGAAKQQEASSADSSSRAAKTEL
mmetsp:Transcript_8691/g.16867  ORF Transcript_8691/g.16867 Transcript_8691/m.16867 type:complete len:223 (+) Transcript_8691:1-669(+)